VAQPVATAEAAGVQSPREPAAIPTGSERASVRVRVIPAVPELPTAPALPAIPTLPSVMQSVGTIPARVMPSTGGPDVVLVGSLLLSLGALGFGLRWLGRHRT
jgi:hypothetical protein